MSRAKTLIEGAERFGVRHQDARTMAINTLTEWEENEQSARERHAKCRAQKRKCKFVRARSYRLAPLVELPAWRSSTDADPWPQRYMVAENDKIHAWIEALGAWGIGDDLDWGNAEIFGEGQEVSVLRALEACESRLRELGYRVARPN